MKRSPACFSAAKLPCKEEVRAPSQEATFTSPILLFNASNPARGNAYMAGGMCMDCVRASGVPCQSAHKKASTS